MLVNEFVIYIILNYVSCTYILDNFNTFLNVVLTISFNSLGLGVVSQRSGDYSAMIAYLLQARSIFPECWTACFGLALAFSHQGQTDKALSFVEQACTLAPSEITPRRLRAEMYFHKNMLENALAELDWLRTKTGEMTSTELANLYKLEASIHTKMGNPVKARKFTLLAKDSLMTKVDSNEKYDAEDGLSVSFDSIRVGEKLQESLGIIMNIDADDVEEDSNKIDNRASIG